eukprot:403340570
MRRLSENPIYQRYDTQFLQSQNNQITAKISPQKNQIINLLEPQQDGDLDFEQSNINRNSNNLNELQFDGEIECQGYTSIAAISENRGREVGIALYTPFKNRITLCQLVDSALYNQTVMILNKFEVKELVMSLKPEKFHILSNLALKYEKLIFIDRSDFNEQSGYDLLKEFVSDSKLLESCPSNYVSITCLSALLLHLEANHKIQLDSSITNLTFFQSSNSLYIDQSTCQKLSLISLSGDSKKDSGITLQSLFKTINPLGQKLLRRMIVSPSANPSKLNYYYEILETLLNSHSKTNLCILLQNYIKQMNQIESSHTQIVYVMRRYTVKRPITFLSNLIRFIHKLKQFFALMSLVQDKIPCMREKLQSINTEKLSDFIQSIEAYFIINDQGKTGSDHDEQNGKQKKMLRGDKNQKGKVGFEIVKKLKNNPNSKIGFQSALIKKLNQDVQEYCNKKILEFKNRFSLGGIKLKQDSLLGWYLEVKKETYEQHSELFKDYVACKTLKNVMQVVDPQIQMLNERINQLLICINMEMQLLLEETIFRHIKETQSEATKVFQLIARLDVSLAFVRFIQESKVKFVKPKIVENTMSNQGSMEQPIVYAKEAYHPLLQLARKPENITNNDIYLNNLSSKLTLLNGMNGSGKTTFLKTIQLLIVLAQIGCYVPASEFIFTPLNSMYLRAGTEDSIERGLSSFKQEMQEISNVLNQLQQHSTSQTSNNQAQQKQKHLSLICFDELGINTSLEQGFPLMWSICEHLLKLSNLVTMISTHNQLLNQLALIYPQVQRMRVEMNLLETGNSHTTNNHKVVVWKDGNNDNRNHDQELSDDTQLDEKQFNYFFFKRFKEIKSSMMSNYESKFFYEQSGQINQSVGNNKVKDQQKVLTNYSDKLKSMITQ